ncbi:WD domain, G-beta repeat-containing protein [Cardiosporidium cionae]|uniref:WD domain, G-beta repeat-containing protein n=1 Tax=Cardiosporidium cionae TaxID=476202 RepID=A0ABQ7JAU4_9APIC|nr:WD domain, G-beta repeat-containing protein [Cardiosporidium cionae]|eukprot:KAF8821073.1 WD domain, G-beta repeat-containing protein [Cardiosporidium cionae]
METQGMHPRTQWGVSLVSAESLQSLQEHFLVEKQKASDRLTRAKETIRLSFPRHSLTDSSSSSSDNDMQEGSTEGASSSSGLVRSSRKIGKSIMSERESMGINGDTRMEALEISSRSYNPRTRANHYKQTEASFKDSTVQSSFAAISETEKIMAEFFSFDYPVNDSTSLQPAKSANRKEKDKKNQFKLNSGTADSAWGYSRVIPGWSFGGNDDEVDLDSHISSKQNSGMKLGWIRSFNPFKRASKAETDTSFDDTPSEVSRAADNTEVIENLEAFSIPVKVNVKTSVELSDLRCIRDIHVEKDTPIWCIAICPHCEWLAVGTHSGLVALWKFPAVEESFEKCEEATTDPRSYSNKSKTDPTKSEWLISDQPTLKLDGHTAAVIQLVWSLEQPASRLLSVSLDSTVRLWDPAEGVNAIAVLHCNNWPIAACFHPVFKDVMFTGCLKAILRMWKLELHTGAEGCSKRGKNKAPHAAINSFRKYDAHISEQTTVPDLVTAMSLSPNGAVLAVGFKGGSVGFYESRTLHLLSEVDCKNRRGKNAKGRKVTGLVWKLTGSEICITTNDSRIRVFDVNELACIAKFKGHLNDKTLIRAEFTADEHYVICGSENGWICLWDTVDPHVPPMNPKFNWSKKKRPTNTSYEAFRAFHDNLTSFTVGKQNLTALVLSRLILLDSNLCAPMVTSTSTTTAITKKGYPTRSAKQLRNATVAGRGTERPLDYFKSNGPIKAPVRNLVDADTNKSAHALPSAWLYDEKLCLVSKTFPQWRKDSVHGSCKDLVFIGGSASGTIRIFINIGFPMKR